MQTIEQKRLNKRLIDQRHYILHGEKIRARTKRRMKKDRELNPEKDREKCKEWRKVNKKWMHNYNLMRTYGISAQQKIDLLNKQGNQCAICLSDDPKGINWHVDHCHETKKIRGILCASCNLLLGKAKDNPKILRNAAKYVENNGGEIGIEVKEWQR